VKIKLIVHHELDPNSGAAGQTDLMRDQYHREGHDVDLYSWSDLPHRFSPRLKQLLFPVFVAWHLVRAVRRERPDVVDASTGDSWLWALLDPGRRRTVLVTTSHGLEHVRTEARRQSARDGLLELSWKYPLYYGGLHLREVQSTLRRADIVFLLNRYDRTYAIERLGVDPARVKLVANGIRDPLIGLPLEPTPFDPSIPLRVALVFSYLPLKGVTYGAEALTRTLRRHPNLSATLLGTGVRRDVVLRDFASDLHDRIEVIPRYENAALPSYLHGHQIILFPTLTEGFGVALLEAMACGLAPVSTTTPGPLEFVTSNENGFLVRPRDAEALAEALEKLIDDRLLLDRMRRAAHATAQRFTLRSVALERISHYEQAIAVRERMARSVPE
jgi:glycosyltransferase involved in cell wall biosynthesis